MTEIRVEGYNLEYIDCSDMVATIVGNINKLNIDGLKVSDSKKLTFHYFICSLLDKSKNRKMHYRPVYFIFSESLNVLDADYLSIFKSVMKQLKNTLPIPVIVVDDGDIFIKNNGSLREINEKMSNLYMKRKMSLRKLNKYVFEEEYYELIKVLKNAGNIALLST